MAERRIGIIMHGVTGRMGANQHLARSIAEIRKQGGVPLKDGTRLMPDPILVGRNAGKLESLARTHGIERWTTDLAGALESKSDSLFFDVSFGVAPGEHAALVGPNGVGKSTLLRILAGELSPDEGSFQVGGMVLTMPQDAGMAAPDATLRDLLLTVAPPALRDAGRALVAAEDALASGTDDGTAYASALTAWGSPSTRMR